jgi:hypothetical protein
MQNLSMFQSLIMFAVTGLFSVGSFYALTNWRLKRLEAVNADPRLARIEAKLDFVVEHFKNQKSITL